MGEYLNRVTLIGRLGQDPDIRTSANGKQIANFSVATSETWGKGEEAEEKTTWHRVAVFSEALAAYAADRLSKGCWCFVEGKLQINKWTDKDGNERQMPQIAVDSFMGGLRLIEGKSSGYSGPPRAKKPRQKQFAPGERAFRMRATIDPELNDPLPF